MTKVAEPRPYRPVTDVYSAEQLIEFRDNGYWSGISVFDYLDQWAEASPDSLALVDDQSSLTAAEWRDQATRLAGFLSSTGVRAGDRVLVQLPNRVEAAVAVLAVARIGAIVTFAQATLRSRELGHLIERTGPVAAVIPAEFRGFDFRDMYRDLAQGSPSLRAVVVVGPAEHGFTTLDQALQSPPYEGPRPAPDDPFGIIFTSGTTAVPKACLHTSNTVAFSGRFTGRAMGITSSDVMFMPSPILHSTGIAIGLLTPLVYRIPVVLQAVWKPDDALRLISEHGCTVTLGATPFGRMLLDVYDPDRHDVSRFRLFGLAGTPIPPSVVQDLDRLFGCSVMAAYGSTEGLLGTATLPDDSLEQVCASDGKAVEGVSIKVVDEAGRTLPPGQEGQLCVRCPGRLIGYWGEPDRLATVLDDDGYMLTGDLARIDENGYMRITGRLAEIINRGGVKFSPIEVEQAIAKMPGIAEVAVAPVPDDKLGERACAFVVPAEGIVVTLQDIAAHLDASGMAKYSFPERLELVSELPRTPTGKVERFRLTASVGGGPVSDPARG